MRAEYDVGQTFAIGSKPVGGGAPALVVGEVGQAHDGSLGLAHAFIDAIAAAGADAVKFQAHIAAAESTRGEPWRVRFSTQDASRYEYWRRMEFQEAHWLELKRHADERQLLFLCSAFSEQAVDMLSRLAVPAWKVASGEITNHPLLERMAETRLPMLLSSGMSSLAEIDAAVGRVRALGSPVAVLQCSSAYPCPPEQLGLNLLEQFRQRYRCPVGLSDHSGTSHAGIAAAALGCDVLEVHVTLSREMFGPDVAASVTTPQLKQLVEGVRFVERARAHPVDKDAAAKDLLPMRQVFGRSIVAREALAAGTRLETRHLVLKKPGSGMPPDRLPAVLGRRLLRALEPDEMLRQEDVD